MYQGLVTSFDPMEGIGRIHPKSGSPEITFKFEDGRIPTPDLHLPSMEPGELLEPKEGDRVVYLSGNGTTAFVWAYEDAYREACGC